MKYFKCLKVLVILLCANELVTAVRVNTIKNETKSKEINEFDRKTKKYNGKDAKMKTRKGKLFTLFNIVNFQNTECPSQIM